MMVGEQCPSAAGRRAWLFAGLLVVITVIAYLPVWRAGFIWDDDTLLLQNPGIHSAGGLARLWGSDFPLATTSLWLEWRLWGPNPLGYHLVNVLFHALSAVVLWRVLLRLNLPGAGLAAAIFAVHPVNVESVAWISERKNTLCMLFYLASLLLYLRAGAAVNKGPSAQGVGKPRAPRLLYWCSVGFFGLALLSKTAVAPLPLFLVGLAWWQQGRLTLKDVWRMAPFFVLAAGAGVMSWWFQIHQAIGASMLDVRDDSFWARLAGAGWAIWFYLYKALLPLHLSFVYPRWKIDATQAISYVPGLLVVAVFVVGWWYRRRWGKAVLLGLGYFVAMLLPVLGFVNIYFMRYSLVADHWQYFAVLGPIAVAAMGVTLMLNRLPGLAGGGKGLWGGGNPTLVLVGAALVLVLGALTWRQALAYRDLKSLWTATVASNPSARVAHNNLGTLLLAEGKADEALAHFRQAVALEPNAADVHSNLGAALLKQGQLDEAIVHLRQAVKIQPDSVNAQSNLGNALCQQGHWEEGIRHLQEAVRLQPAVAIAHCNLGNTLLQAGRMDEAVAEFQLALALQPDMAEAHTGLGTALLTKGQGREALAQLQQAVQLRPDLPAGHLNLANALVQEGRGQEAIPHFEQVLAMQPGSAVAHNGLGNALSQTGRTEEALAQYRAALGSEPRFVMAHLNLANLLLQQKHYDGAIAEFETVLRLQPNLAAAQNNLANALLAKGLVDAAIGHFESALQLQPNLAEAHNGLANALLQAGRAAEAVKHYEAALAAMPNHPYLLNNLAWVLATSPDAAVRNGVRAVELAQQAQPASGGKDPAILGTLAAAYAEAGRYSDAVTTARRALDLANTQTNASEAETLRARLKLYESGVPFRDTEQMSRAVPSSQ